MRKFNIDWKLAFDIVKMRRDIVDPNDGFISKLRDYDEKLILLSRNSIKRNRSVSTEILEENEDYISQDSGDDIAESSTSSEDLMERQCSIEI